MANAQTTSPSAPQSQIEYSTPSTETLDDTVVPRRGRQGVNLNWDHEDTQQPLPRSSNSSPTPMPITGIPTHTSAYIQLWDPQANSTSISGANIPFIPTSSIPTTIPTVTTTTICLTSQTHPTPYVYPSKLCTNHTEDYLSKITLNCHQLDARSKINPTINNFSSPTTSGISTTVKSIMGSPVTSSINYLN